MSDLVSGIERKLLARPVFRKMSTKLFPVIATVIDYNEETNSIKISYPHPLKRGLILKDEVELIGFRGANVGFPKKDDTVMIVFPSGNVEDPVVVSIYTKKTTVVTGGSYNNDFES